MKTETVKIENAAEFDEFIKTFSFFKISTYNEISDICLMLTALRMATFFIYHYLLLVLSFP